MGNRLQGSGGESGFLRKILHLQRLEMVLTWSKVAIMELERGRRIWGIFYRSSNVLDTKDQKGGIANNNKMFGMSNQIFGAGLKNMWKSKFLFESEMPGNQLAI